jgi:hypothetical protein
VTDRPTPDSTGEHDRVRPFHAKETSSGQEAAEAVAAVLKHAAERDQAAKLKAPPKQQPKWMLPLGLNLGVLATYLLIAPPSWVVVNPIAPPPDEEVVDNLRTGMFFVKARVDSYRTQRGRLPASLEEAGVSPDQAAEIGYTPRADSTYVLIAIVGEQTLSYDSSRQTPDEAFGDLSTKIGG